MSFRVSLRWDNRKTEANRRKPTKEDEGAKLLALHGLREKNPSLLMFLEIGQKNPCLLAKSDPRAASCSTPAFTDVYALLPVPFERERQIRSPFLVLPFFLAHSAVPSPILTK